MATRRSLYQGRVGDFGLEQVVLPNGARVELEVLRHPGAAAVVPLHDDGTITLIRQYRHAAGGMIWEVPAGKLEPGEAPEPCALRELEEETGLRAGRIRHLTTILTTPGFTDEVIHLYVAEDLTPVGAHPEADEVIERHRLAPADIRAMIHTGELRDAKSLVALLLVLG